MKYLKPFYYLLLMLQLLCHSCDGSASPKKAGNVQKCGGGKISSNPLEIGMSPGFISGSTAYTGHHLCTNDGICEKPPLICPQSSCCLSTYNTTNIGNILLPVSYSQCGCYDPKRKTCKPQSAFRLDWTTCGDYGQVISKSELAKISMSNSSCIESASVDLDVDDVSGNIRIRVKSQLCFSKAGSNHRGLVNEIIADGEHQVEGTVGVLENTIIPGTCDQVPGKTAQGLLSSKYLQKCENPSRDQSKNRFCDNYPVSSNTVIMSPGFISFGGISNFASPSICGFQGNCQDSLSECQGTSCCSVSLGGSSSNGSCECFTGNSGNCLLDHKTFTIGHTACTQNGEVVQRKLTIRIPSAGENNCKNGTSSSWSTASVDFENIGNGKILMVVKTQQCV